MSADRTSTPSSQSVHTCHAECPCHAGGQPVADFIDADMPNISEPGEGSENYPLYWRVKVIRPEWHGRRCRIVIHGGRGNRLIEFDDGERVVCPGTYLRRAPQSNQEDRP